MKYEVRYRWRSRFGKPEGYYFLITLPNGKAFESRETYTSREAADAAGKAYVNKANKKEVSMK